MPKPKISYFDFPGGRGEDCRLALHIAGVEFIDDRVPGKEWSDRKASTPFGAMPVLELDGKQVAQSNAILRFIGSQHDLHPKDPWEAARHDALMDAVEDLRHQVTPTLRIKDEVEKKAAREELASGFLQTWGANVERQLEQGEGPFVAGDKLNVADLKLHTAVKWFRSGTVDHVSPDVFQAFPRLSAIYEAVQANEKVVDWYSES